MNVQEIFDYKRVNASATLFTGTGILGGFLCSTAGNVTVTDASDVDIVSTIAVVAGQFVPMPFACGNGAKCVLAGGCIGTFAIGR
jgi:hypothetical protein